MDSKQTAASHRQVQSHEKEFEETNTHGEKKRTGARQVVLIDSRSSSKRRLLARKNENTLGICARDVRSAECSHTDTKTQHAEVRTLEHAGASERRGCCGRKLPSRPPASEATAAADMVYACRAGSQM